MGYVKYHIGEMPEEIKEYDDYDGNGWFLEEHNGCEWCAEVNRWVWSGQTTPDFSDEDEYNEWNEKQ